MVLCVRVCLCSCERANQWLDESAYAVDISILPRGGSRRRKSMEPRALLNTGGELTKAVGVGGGKRSISSAEMTQKFKHELVHTPAARGRASERAPAESQVMSPDDGGDDHDDDTGAEAEVEDGGSGFSTPTGALALSTAAALLQPATTPTGFVNYDPSASTCQTPAHTTAAGPDGGLSPTTPDYLAQGAKLVQMTCPPKQTGQGLFEKEDESGGAAADQGMGFPISGRIGGDVGDEKVRKRLVDVRRRTLMAWKPVVGSPLGR